MRLLLQVLLVALLEHSLAVFDLPVLLGYFLVLLGLPVLLDFRLCLCSVIWISLITLSSWLCCTCCRLCCASCWLCCASCWISLSTLVCWLCCWLSLVRRCSWLCCRISLSTSICVRLCIGISWLCWLILCRLILLCCRRCCRVNRYKCNSGN